MLKRVITFESSLVRVNTYTQILYSVRVCYSCIQYIVVCLMCTLYSYIDALSAALLDMSERLSAFRSLELSVKNTCEKTIDFAM